MDIRYVSSRAFLIFTAWSLRKSVTLRNVGQTWLRSHACQLRFGNLEALYMFLPLKNRILPRDFALLASILNSYHLFQYSDTQSIKYVLNRQREILALTDRHSDHKIKLIKRAAKIKLFK